MTGAANTCPRCRTPIQVGQNVCGQCGYKLGGTPTRTEGAPTAERENSLEVYGRLAEFVPALIAALSMLFLPLVSTAGGHLTLLDIITRTFWLASPVFDLLIFGLLGAVVLSARRMNPQSATGARAVAVAFGCMVAGGALLFVTAGLVNYHPDIGLWLGLGSGVVGFLVCRDDWRESRASGAKKADERGS